MAEDMKMVSVKDVIDILFSEFQSYWEIPCLPFERAVQQKVCNVRDRINKLVAVDVKSVATGTENACAKLVQAKDDLISRSALIGEFEWLKSVTNESSKAEIEETIQRIRNATAVEARPVVHGRWVCVPVPEGLPRYQCDQCGHYVDAGDDRNFCPNCGARMINVHDEIHKIPLEGFVENEKFNDLREAFIDYVCSGVPNPATYCKNRCAECVDARGWCVESFCKGFNP